MQAPGCVTPSRGCQQQQRQFLSPTPVPHPQQRFAGCKARQRSAATSDIQDKWQVYTGRMPLIGLEGAAAALEGTAAAGLLRVHTYVLLEGPDQSIWYLDFLPLNPTAPQTALLLLSGGRAPGEVRVKKLAVQQVKANDKVRLLGESSHPDPLTAAQAYNRSHCKELHLLLNNCMHYTNGLTRVLLPEISTTGNA